MPQRNDLILPREAATILRRAPGTLANWRAAGRGPAWLEVEGRVLYSRRVLRAYLAARINPRDRAPDSRPSLAA